MKQIVELSDMKSRAEAVRWNLGDVSVSAGFARATAYQVVGHQNPKRNTHEAMSDAIIAEEIRLRDYLVALHPIISTAPLPQELKQQGDDQHHSHGDDRASADPVDVHGGGPEGQGQHIASPAAPKAEKPAREAAE